SAVELARNPNRFSRNPIPDTRYPSSRNWQPFQYPLNQILRLEFFRFRLVRNDDAVAHHVEDDRLDVLRGDIAAAFEEGLRSRSLDQRDCRPRAGTELDQAGHFEAVLRRVAGRLHDIDDVVLD